MSRLSRLSLAALAALAATGAPLRADDAMILIPSFTEPAGQAPAASGGGGADRPADAGARLSRKRADPAPDAGSVVDAPLLAPLLSPLPLRGASRSLRLQGEAPTAEFTLFLPGGAPPESFVVRHESGVAVLSERSSYEVFVNDVPLGRMPLGRGPDDDADTFEVPPEIWREGTNRVRFELRQVHRIACGPEAAFDLWTDISLARSGAPIAARPAVSGAADFLAAVSRDAADGVAVDLRDPNGLAGGAHAVLDPLALALGRLADGYRIGYADSPAWSTGTDRRRADASHARITLVPLADGPDDDRSRVSFRRGGDGAEVMVLHVAPDDPGLPALGARLAQRIDALIRLDGPAPTTGDGIALGADTRIVPGEPVALETFGFDTTVTSSHYFQGNQVFTLPRDWMVLTARDAILHLDYAYARDLPEGAMLLVRVNGETVRNLPLRGEGGTLIEKFPVKFRANLLRDGPNLLQFEALIPGAEIDTACAAQSFPKLEIRGSSTLTVPRSPRMRVPDLRRAVAGLRAGAITSPDGGTIRLGEAERLELVSALGAPAPDSTRLSVLRVEDYADLPMGDYAIPPRALSNVLTRDPIVRGGRPKPGAAPAASVLGDARGGGTASYGGLFSQAMTNTVANLIAVKEKVLPDADAAAARWLDTQRGRAVLLQLDVTDPGHLWLLLGPSTSLTEVAGRIGAARQSILSPRGQISVLGRDGTWRSWADGQQMPRLQEPVTFGNYRDVMGNYASWQPLYFTGLVFAMALLFAAVALRLVVLTRRNT